MRDTAASRKFIDLIRQASSKWANWDPPIKIKVGDYGTIDSESGELDVEGNIYEAAFQESLNKQGLKIDLSDESCQPQKGGLDDNIIMSSSGVKQGDFSMKPEVSFLNLASASVKAEFQFQEGKRGAILVMHKPLQEYIPRGKVLNLVHNATELHDKYLVTSTFTCPGYYIYLSNKSGERIALALAASAPILAAGGVTAGGAVSVDWWTDAQAAFLRKAFDKAGQYRYTPLYAMKRQNGNGLIRRLFRGEGGEGEDTEDDLWLDCTTPWEPLDEDGEQDPVWEDANDEFAPRSAVEGSLPFAE
ncbi:hypothetical protein DEU56DRAFT_782530 [Suillus clintonianus]|uniref:uncharacterized protein n=1 Tax=Suillus clintonianus TaxID=1904413 RepID=UPI001B8868BE|nr:uncharacterized protein DEU56DRAFT_782530 [Suillus clintonianus]KAG2148858.1 hypothetical protein DEU56DRAFT_782530 [Suillus clintonianus]